MMQLLELFFGFFYIGIMAIGGGYAALPFLRQQCVEVHGWITMTEFADLLTLSQITPGTIAINSATFVGTKIAGTPGALVATLGFVLPPFLIVSALWRIYLKYRRVDLMQGIFYGLKPTVVALIATSGILVLQTAIWGEAAVTLAGVDWLAVGIMALAFVAARKWKLSSMVIIFGSGALGLVAEIFKNIF